MPGLTSLLFLGAAAFSSVSAVPHRNAKRGPVEDFITGQTPIALENLLCNIGADGCRAAGAAPGAVVASPDKVDPPYFFTWNRDSALVFKNLVERFSYNYDASLQSKIHDYIRSQAKLQTVPNLAGGFADGRGLGEAKYEVDLGPYGGEWGRPQHDGPPLRAIALMGYVKWLIANGYPETAQKEVWPVIRNDLAYVSHFWDEKGFDLWEEVEGDSYFTAASQYRALVEGAALAPQVGQTCESCSEMAPHILCWMQNHWDDSLGAINSNINTVYNQNRAGLDANSILTSIHNFDPALGCDDLTLQPCSARGLSNHKKVVDSMRVWGINNGIPAGFASAVGRYVEDVYYGGNPWILATFAAAEQLYDAVHTWNATGSIEITPVSLGFFQDRDDSASVGTLSKGTPEFDAMMNKIWLYADGFMSKVQEFLPNDGSMAEQYDKNTGTPLGAKHLTWSYASFLTCAAARANARSSTFGWAAGLNPSLPGSCNKNTKYGWYIAAPEPNLGTMTVGGGSQTITETFPEPTKDACLVTAQFGHLVETVPGETIKIVGNSDRLGNWNTGNGVTLHADYYTQDKPEWSVQIPIFAGESLEYKFIKVSKLGDVTWQNGDNLQWTAGNECGAIQYINTSGGF